MNANTVAIALAGALGFGIGGTLALIFVSRIVGRAIREAMKKDEK